MAARPLTLIVRNLATGVTTGRGAAVVPGIGYRVNSAQLNYQQASEVLMSNYQQAPFTSEGAAEVHKLPR